MFQTQRYFRPSEAALNQQKLDIAATSAKAKLKLNEAFFASSLPALYQQLMSLKSKRFRTFYTRFENLNLLDTSSGVLLYNQQPKQQSEQSAANFLARPLTEAKTHSGLHISPLIPDEARTAQSKHAKGFRVTGSTSGQVLVVMGVGLGYFLPALIQQSQAKALIIYEKHLDMLLASMEVIDWQSVFELATKNGIALFIQAGNDGSTLDSDLAELAQALPFDAVSYYRHYPDRTYDRAVLKRLGLRRANTPLPAYSVSLQACLDVVPASAEVAESAKASLRVQEEESLRTLGKHKPHMATLLKKVKLTQWQPYINQHGQLNAFDILTGWPLHCDAHPIMSNATELQDQRRVAGTYMAAATAAKSIRTNYRYYQLAHAFMDAQQDHLQRQTGSQEPLDDYAHPAITINGIGLGYQLCWLLQQYQLKQLSIATLLEPDIELLYLSLQSCNWLQLLEHKIDFSDSFTFLLDAPETGYRVPLEAVYNTKHGAALNAAVYFSPFDSEKAKSVLNAFLESSQRLLFGAKYDDNLYHLNHAAANLKNGAKVLVKRAQDTKTPIVLVGNGPSLDQNMQWLKKNHEKVIIVSCGTSIYTLYRAGIVPDFHAEVEIVKVVAEMKQSIPDEDLKKIDLLASISAHPDLLAQFGNEHLVVRQGLDVTAALKSMQAVPSGVVETQHGAPTCANLAASVMLEAGYQNLILCGVDLAARDDGQHHASNSYYDDQSLKLLHGFTEKDKANERLLVDGVDGSKMVSKPEFIFAAEMLATAFARHPSARVVNLSRGAAIGRTEWHDDRSYTLATGAIDKAAFKQRFQKGFRELKVTSGLYTTDKVIDLINQFEHLFAELEAQFRDGGLAPREYFNVFRAAIDSIDNDPAHLIKSLFSGTSRFYESNYLAFAVRLEEASSLDAEAAFAEAFNVSYEPWSAFCRNAIIDLRSDPLCLEGSSLKDNDMLATG